MTDPSAPRAPAVGPRGAVSAGHPLVAEAAARVLREGGNVVDAALAASGVAAVVEPAWCGIGGDAFFLVHRASGETVVLNGSGAAPGALSDDVVAAPAVPRTGPLSIAVPGIAAAWGAAASRFASVPLQTLLAPAIGYAQDGFPIYPRLARAIAGLDDATDVSAGLAALLRDTGRSEGETFRQADLARSLGSLAADPSAFYQGPLARSVARAVLDRGGRLSVRDLADHRAEWTAPARARYRGREVLTHPPVSLGCVLLQELRIVEGFDLRSFAPGDPGLIEIEVAAAAAAAEDADRFLGDPATRDAGLEWILSDERAEWWRDRISTDRASRERPPVAAGSDTTTIVVADGAGNCACVLQSLFNEWGSRELVPTTGAILNDRLANVRVGGGRPDRLRAGERPLHTLHTYLVLSDGRLVAAGATPGGRGQAQTNLQVLVNVLDLGDNVQAAIDRPRWLRGLPRRGEDRTVYLESGFSAGVPERLRQGGHPVEDAPAGGLEPFGNCTVIARDGASGELSAGSDRRRGGRALAW